MPTVSLYSQQSLDFNVQGTACINERLLLNVANAGEEEIEWDFCGNQLEGTYSGVYRGTIGTMLTNINIVEDNDHWYGFAVSRTNQLFRLDLGDNPANAPLSIVSLGNPDNSIFSPEGIDIVKEGNTWYGLVTNLGNEITRLTWGSSLTNIPRGERLNLGTYSKLNVPIEIEILHDNNQYVAVVTNSSDNRLTLINFGNSLSNTPTDMDMKMSSPFPGGLLMYGVASAKVCNDWTLYVVASNKLYRVALDNELFDDIEPEQITDITSDVPIAIGEYNHVRTLVEGTDVHVFFSSYTGVHVQSVIWRAGASHAVFNDLELPAIGYNPYGFDVFNNDGRYGLLVTGYNDGAFSQVTATAPCNVNQRFSNEINPNTFYTQGGTYEVILKVRYADGTVCASRQPVNVSLNSSPAISFTFSDVKCVNTVILFTPIGDIDDINLFNWNFGDASNSPDANPDHEYGNAGVFPVTLSVTGENGCSNFSLDTIQIYLQPVPLFTGPAGVICTHTELLFNNNTVDEFDGNLMYEWLVNDEVKSTARDFSTMLTTPNPLNIKLRTSISGCLSQAEQQYSNVFEGPVVSFSSTGQCQDDIVNFTNTTSGVSDYFWNFGDSQTSTEVNPIHIYANPDLYTVTLTASNAAGCNNTLNKQVNIYSAPQVDFTALTPPFSCSGTPTQFNDLTPPPGDSNLSSWNWNFGDTGSASNTSTQRNAQHTYATAADYTVSLTVTTNFSCSKTFQKPITIYQTPVAAFTHSALCEDAEIMFSDAASTNQAWSWQIGTDFYFTEHPEHIFNNPGNYDVTLSVTGVNACIGSTTATVVIPNKLGVDFSATKTCINQEAEFADLTDDSSDPITEISWDFGGQETSATTPAIFIFSETGTFNVTLTVTTESGCQYPLTKPVNITEGPLAAFTATPNTGEAPLTVQFTNTSLNANTFNWSFNSSGSVSTAPSPAFVYVDEGSYTVELVATDLNGCADTTRQLIEAQTPSELNPPSPNPGSGAFTIEWKTNEATRTVIVLVDAMGREIRNFEVMANAGLNRYVLDITGEQAGFYILKIRYLNAVKTYRLMVSE